MYLQFFHREDERSFVECSVSSDGIIEWHLAQSASVALEGRGRAESLLSWQKRRGPRPLAGAGGLGDSNPRFDGDSSPGRHPASRRGALQLF